MTKRFFKYFTVLALATMSALSCSKSLFLKEDHGGLDGRTGKLVISGMAVDREGTPAEGIIMTFLHSGMETAGSETDGDGIFTMEISGFTSQVTGFVTSHDPEGMYKDSKREITVTWNGKSYDYKTATFFLNDCNFILQRK